MTLEKRSWIVPPGLVEKVEEFSFESEVCIKEHQPILVMGATGVGKTLFLKIFERFYADLYPRHKIATANCAHFQKELARAELFGYVPGAYTGAINDPDGKDGWIREGEEGLLVLEEIGELPPEVQSMLLLFIEDGTFTKLGDNTVLRSNQLILGATNNQLSLRKDFLQRFSHFYVPSIYERRGDVLYYLALKFPDVIKKLRPWEILAMLAFHWPGNVREIDRIGRKLRDKKLFTEKRLKELQNAINNEKSKIKRTNLQELYESKTTKHAWTSGTIESSISKNDSLLGTLTGWPLYIDIVYSKIDTRLLETALNQLNVGLDFLDDLTPFADFAGLEFEDGMAKRAPRFYVDEFMKNHTPHKLAAKIKKNNHGVETFRNINIKEDESQQKQEALTAQHNTQRHTSSKSRKENLDTKDLHEINKVLMQPNLYWLCEEKKSFKDLQLPSAMTALSENIKKHSENSFAELGIDIQSSVIRLNRMLIEALYPNECPRHEESAIWFIGECEYFKEAFYGLQFYCRLFFQNEMADHDLFERREYCKHTDTGPVSKKQMQKRLKGIGIDIEEVSRQVVEYLIEKDDRQRLDMKNKEVAETAGTPSQGSKESITTFWPSLREVLGLSQESGPEHHLKGDDLFSMKYENLAHLYQCKWLKKVGWDFKKMEEKTGISYNTLRNRFRNVFSSAEFDTKCPWEDLINALCIDTKAIRPDGKDAALKWLNDLLAQSDLYDVLSKKGLVYSGYIKDLIELTTSVRDNKLIELSKHKASLLKILNRLLIEETYPEKCPGQPKAGGKA